MFALVSATRPGIAEPLWAFTASNAATLTASYHACIAALPYLADPRRLRHPHRGLYDRRAAARPGHYRGERSASRR
jgi:hypothetical protein